MDFGFIIAILAAGINASTPLLWAGMGVLLSEKSGIIHLGAEGIMLMSGLTGFAIAHGSGSLWLAILGAGIVGALCSAVHAWVCITIKGNAIVSGLALTMLGMGLTGYFGKPWIGVAPDVWFSKWPIPGLSQIPWLGPIAFSQNILVYASYGLVVFMILLLYRTDWGLSIRATGEHPQAAAARGIPVTYVQYISVIVAGVFMGIAGVYLSLAYTHIWGENMAAGRGWIAIALVIFASWHPGRLMFGAYLFGTIESLQLFCQASGYFTEIPVYFLTMFPMILTIFFLAIRSRREQMQQKQANLG